MLEIELLTFSVYLTLIQTESTNIKFKISKEGSFPSMALLFIVIGDTVADFRGCNLVLFTRSFTLAISKSSSRYSLF